MCTGFGGFIDERGNVYFTMCDRHGDFSHHETAKLIDDGIEVVPFEASDWTKNSLEWHDCWTEDMEEPKWVTKKLKRKILNTMRRVKVHVDEYLNVYSPARAEYTDCVNYNWGTAANIDSYSMNSNRDIATTIALNKLKAVEYSGMVELKSQLEKIEGYCYKEKYLISLVEKKEMVE